MLENNDSSSNVVENNDFINPIALNFAAIVGNLFLFHWLFKTSRFLLILGSFDCGSTCPPPKWVHINYPFDNLSGEIYLFITIICTIIFILLCLFANTQVTSNKNEKNFFLNLLYLFYSRVGLFVFLANSIFRIVFNI